MNCISICFSAPSNLFAIKLPEKGIVAGGRKRLPTGVWQMRTKLVDKTESYKFEVMISRQTQCPESTNDNAVVGFYTFDVRCLFAYFKQQRIIKFRIAVQIARSFVEMASACCGPSQGSYEVCITIFEGKHLVQNANPVVVVKVGDRKRKTAVRERTDNPYYNEYFVFDFDCDLETLLATRITISVYLRNCLGQLKYYAGIGFEVATVWDQPDHQYYHKWAMLMNPKDIAYGSKGYVKCNISINAMGQMLKSYPETEGEEDIEGNLLLPLEGASTRRRVQYIFTIYRVDGLTGMGGFRRRQNHAVNVNPYVQLSFLGMKGSTSTRYNSNAPQFNEHVIFQDMFPPYCYRVRVAIKDRRSSGCRKNLIATRILNLKQFSSFEYDHLPTFGPAFVHFYGNGSARECSCIGRCDVRLPAYKGRLLLALTTLYIDPEAPSTPLVATGPCAPIVEKTLWNTEEYLLVGIIYDVSMIQRCKYACKKINFEISLGNAGNKMLSYSQHVESSGDGLLENVTAEKSPDFESTTLPMATASTDRKYDYLPCKENKPCMHVKSWWPNLEWRSLNSNSLSNIAHFLGEQLEKLEELASIERENTYEEYNAMIETLDKLCKNYLRLLERCDLDENGGTTTLDRRRYDYCQEKVSWIIKVMKINGYLPNNNYLKIAMIHAYKYLRILHELGDDPQDCLPDVYIWMIAGSKRIAYTRLSSLPLMYHEDSMACGYNCGKRVSLFFTDPLEDSSEVVDESACNAEIYLWLGNVKHSNACWSFIPPGYEVDHEASEDSFPTVLKYNDYSKFQLRAHIFQGRFDAGMDSSGLGDPLVRVVFRGHTSATKAIRQTLDPFWDQTLVFEPIPVYGLREHIKRYPPQLIVEAFDEDLCGSLEFSGRCVATPIVKLSTETYSPPDFPPILTWFKFKNEKGANSAILAAFELIETDDGTDALTDEFGKAKIYGIPDDIRPVMTKHRLEVIFWGIRDMKKTGYMSITKPRIIVECCGIYLKSEIMANAKKFCNFETPRVMIELDLPELEIYYPSLTIKAYDSRGFGCMTYLGVRIIPTINSFIEHPVPETEYFDKVLGADRFDPNYQRQASKNTILPIPEDFDSDIDEYRGLTSYERMARTEKMSRRPSIFERIASFFKGDSKEREELKYGVNDDESYDWWSKYFASVQQETDKKMGRPMKYLPNVKPVATFKLEMVPEFERFQDRIATFQLLKGKASDNFGGEEKNNVGTFKGHIAIYRWPHPTGTPCKTRIGNDAELGFCDDYPASEPVKLIVRAYVVRGINLHPKDALTGKADPYLVVKLGNTVMNEKKMYIPNELNPTFGRMFEIDAMLPKEYMLTIQVWDHDAMSADDLIGETKIDIENRYYSRHRPHCGISKVYTAAGYNGWRDRETPTQILHYLCVRNNLPLPEYLENEVKIGNKIFPFAPILDQGLEDDILECMALDVLHKWHEIPVCGCTLVPEHVEQRPLFNSSRPGLEQGKLEVWIDIFANASGPPRPPVDIRQKPPEDYELRVIVWNTDDVPLVDSQFLTGQRCSDIYVKGWLTWDDKQKTDVHYNSLTGEGNFNWRFIFRLTYLAAEQMMLVKKKLSIIARDETTQKLPCRLNLQVWDNDHFSPDDFLGALALDLSKLPRGSSNAKSCELKILSSEAPTVNLFKTMRSKAWWPFVRYEDGLYYPAGKVELELILVPIDEAEEKPVGRGRNPPEAMPHPNRPETSFSWFRNPWKACRFVLCRYYKWKIITFFLILLGALLVGCGIYAFPGYFVKRMLGA